MSQVRVIADSIAKHGGRVTTLVVPLWRPLLAEFNTHRALSRNSASSRAVPVAKMLERVIDNPFVPYHLGKNQKGMQAGEPLTADQEERARRVILRMREACVAGAQDLLEIGLHKQIANRYLEPWLTTEIVVTATEWGNMTALRTETNADGTPMAEPHFFDRMEEIVTALNASTPRSLQWNQWHLPFLTDEEWNSIDWTNKVQVTHGIKHSVARCGRVSYFKQDGLPPTAQEDFDRHDDFVTNGHMSPTEHQARPCRNARHHSGNLIGFTQYRKTIVGENRTTTKIIQKRWQDPT